MLPDYDFLSCEFPIELVFPKLLKDDVLKSGPPKKWYTAGEWFMLSFSESSITEKLARWLLLYHSVTMIDLAL